jgi:hypothetical protein
MFKCKNVSQFVGRYHSFVSCVLNMEDLIWNNICKFSKLQLGIKRPGPEADPGNTFILHYIFIIKCLKIIHRGNFTLFYKVKSKKKKVPGFSPPANYTERATSSCRRSKCQLLIKSKIQQRNSRVAVFICSLIDLMMAS